MNTGNKVADKALKDKYRVKDALKELRITKGVKEEYAESHKGWALTRAEDGLEANMKALELAQNDLAKCEEEENELLTSNKFEESEETEKQKANDALHIAREKYDASLTVIKAALDKAERKHETTMKEIELKYKNKSGKLFKKHSDRYTLLEARVKRLQAAVEASEKNVECLTAKKPAGLATLEAKEKILEMKKQRLEDIEAMNKRQVDSYTSVPAKKSPIPAKKTVQFTALGKEFEKLSADQQEKALDALDKTKQQDDDDIDPRFGIPKHLVDYDTQFHEQAKREALREERERKREEEEKKQRDKEIYDREKRLKEKADLARQDAQRKMELMANISSSESVVDAMKKLESIGSLTTSRKKVEDDSESDDSWTTSDDSLTSSSSSEEEQEQTDPKEEENPYLVGWDMSESETQKELVASLEQEKKEQEEKPLPPIPLSNILLANERAIHKKKGPKSAISCIRKEGGKLIFTRS